MNAVTDLKEFQHFKQRSFVISFSDEGPLLQMLEFFEISHSSYQPINFLFIIKPSNH